MSTNLTSGSQLPSVPPFVAEIDILIRARYPLLYLVTWEEQRLDSIIYNLADSHGKWCARHERRTGGESLLEALTEGTQHL
jgi:hypothetical protein